MHEMSIAQNIVEIVNEILQEHPEYQIQKVYVDIGELMAVVPESLHFCYQAITENTPLEKSELVINTIPIRAVCQNCQEEFELDSFLFICPECGSSDLKELSGRELKIKNLEVD